MEEFLKTYWNDIVELITKIYTYIRDWLIANDEAAE